MQENNLQMTRLLSQKKNLQFLIIVSTIGRYIEDIWIQKCMLGLIFADKFKIVKFTKLKTLINFHYVVCNIDAVFIFL